MPLLSVASLQVLLVGQGHSLLAPVCACFSYLRAHSHSHPLALCLWALSQLSDSVAYTAQFCYLVFYRNRCQPQRIGPPLVL